MKIEITSLMLSQSFTLWLVLKLKIYHDILDKLVHLRAKLKYQQAFPFPFFSLYPQNNLSKEKITERVFGTSVGSKNVPVEA